MIQMAQFHNIKFLKEVEGLSQRQIATKLGISSNTVSKYLREDTAQQLSCEKLCMGLRRFFRNKTGIANH
ncbi:sigma factor-like helix-turn-helix DNA-binding protein [Bacillus sp. Bva_UNVM-123]|uniref:sigma factor-like helix-turn-helix DNA-binding protein n=1 Tax=Bacillus sp. Bva_UNVM-123 TaxID=2829798 RepID=UPI00391F1ADE